MSGENDGCLLFRRCSALASCSAALEYNWPAIPGDNSSKNKTPPHAVILAGRRGSRRGASRGQRQSRWRFKPLRRNSINSPFSLASENSIINSAALAASFRRRSRRLCPTPPDSYFNWIPATLNCSSPPPSAEMMNMSGENDGCLCFRRCSAHPSCSAALEYNWPAIPGDNSCGPLVALRG